MNCGDAALACFFQHSAHLQQALVERNGWDLVSNEIVSTSFENTRETAACVLGDLAVRRGRRALIDAGNNWKLLDAKVLYTVAGGKVVYERP